MATTRRILVQDSNASLYERAILMAVKELKGLFAFTWLRRKIQMFAWFMQDRCTNCGRETEYFTWKKPFACPCKENDQ